MALKEFNIKNRFKGLVRPYATLFALALIVALLARIGLFAMDLTGVLSYDYISASDVPILDVICSILTGPALVAFLFVSGLVLTTSTAGSVLYGVLFARRDDGKARPLMAFLTGWATALVALICALIVASGILSAVQLASMSSKLPALPVLVCAIVVFAAFLGTLHAAASLAICACIARAKAGGSLVKNLVVATTACGIPVMVVTIGTFASIHTTTLCLLAVGLWFWADLMVNISLMVVCTALIQRAAKQINTQQLEASQSFNRPS
ncbi:MAG: hypothetical protein LBP91_01150 [Coriobacteriales bacterium]|jgi:hypothetical protein|nr:hypothetical protein [Coriobacteriales bacterium]